MTRDQQQTVHRAGIGLSLRGTERCPGAYRPGFVAGVLLPALILFGAPIAAFTYYRYGRGYAFSFFLFVMCLYIFFCPRDGLWIAVFIVAVANCVFQYSYEEISSAKSVLGTTSAAYFIGASSVGVGMAMLASYTFTRRRKAPQTLVTSPYLLAAALGVAAVCIVSVGYGLYQGNNPQLVLRHASGPFLLFLYIITGTLLLRSHADWARTVRIAEVVTACYVVAYVARYGGSSLNQGQFLYGEDLSLFYASMFASVCFATLLFSRDIKKKRRAVVLLPLLVIGSVMSGSRGNVAAMLLACAVLLLLKIVKSPGKFTAVATTLGLFFVLNPVRIARDMLQGSSIGDSFAQRFLISPESDVSYNLRVSEIRGIREELSKKPLLGDGLGSKYTYYDPYEHRYIVGTYVDSGFGFMLLRFGYLGTAVAVVWILMMLVFVLRRCRAQPNSENASVAVMFTFYFASLIFAPTFFEFSYSWWGGALCGYIFCLPKVSRSVSGAESRGQTDTLPLGSRIGRASKSLMQMSRESTSRGM
jgi:hypothetical protein